LIDPLAGANDESPLFRPARTMMSVGASACIEWKYVKTQRRRRERRKKKLTLIWPSAAANKAPAFVDENPSKKIVVTL
jgi:hypothetical protein